jgi:hypothetical protein
MTKITFRSKLACLSGMGVGIMPYLSTPMARSAFSVVCGVVNHVAPVESAVVKDQPMIAETAPGR